MKIVLDVFINAIFETIVFLTSKVMEGLTKKAIF
jgi:hypothetical protein